MEPTIPLCKWSFKFFSIKKDTENILLRAEMLTICEVSRSHIDSMGKKSAALCENCSKWCEIASKFPFDPKFVLTFNQKGKRNRIFQKTNSWGMITNEYWFNEILMLKETI